MSNVKEEKPTISLDECNRYASTAPLLNNSLCEEKPVLDLKPVVVSVLTGNSFRADKMAENRYMIEPPTFISDTKSYATYKDDLLRWTRITGVKAENQAEVVVHGFDKHLSGLKEKVTIKLFVTS